jgi:hypothetical protein
MRILRPFIRQFLSEQYAVMSRFKAAFARALPHLPKKELSWRLHFVMGALSYTLAGTDALRLIAALNPRDSDNDEMLLRRLAPFLIAGLRRRCRARRTRRRRRRVARHATTGVVHAVIDLDSCCRRRLFRARVHQRRRMGVGDRHRCGAGCRLVLDILLPTLLLLVLGAALVLLAFPLNWVPLRRKLVSDGILTAFRRILPPMSQTEREAIEAGTVWWDGDLFSGRPDWNKLLAVPQPKLTPDEQRFVDNECEELCGLVSDWETTHIYRDLPPHVWQFIKDRGFLGMIIPKEYGGLGFSAFAHSEVVAKLASRSSAA